MTLSDISIRRPVFAWMLMFGLMFFGVLSFQRLGVSQLPESTASILTIQVTWTGAAPQIMETEIVNPIEEAVISVQGVEDIEADIRQSAANIKLTFSSTKNIDAALQETNSKLRSVLLPADVLPPTIEKFDTDAQPIMWLAATSSQRSYYELIRYIDLHLRSRFEVLPGVANLILGGWQERNLRVWVDNKKLIEHQLTILDVKNTLARENQEIASGYLENEQSQMNVRTMGEAITPQEMANLRITTRGGERIYNSNIRIGDVATVEDNLADQRGFARSDGNTTIGIGIQKQHGENDVAVGNHVKEFLKQINAELAHDAPDLHIGINFDGTRFTEQSIAETEFTLILSILITGVVCWLFLGSWISTFNVLLSIPTSILGTFILMDILGFTLNFATLLGLSLAVGIVVDDAIMVLENIVRHFHMGKTARDASLDGAREITFAALAATLAVAAIFSPVIFVQMIIGNFIGIFLLQFGLTLTVAVLLSFLESVTLTPMRCAQFMTRREDESRLSHFVNGRLNALATFYQNILAFCLNHRWVVLGLSLLIFIGSLCSVAVIRKEFFPPQDIGTIFIQFQTPVGSSLEFTREQALKLEAIIRANPMIEHVFVNVGGFQGGETNKGLSFIQMKDLAGRRALHDKLLAAGQNVPYTQADVSDQMREQFIKAIPPPTVDVKVIDISNNTGNAKKGTNLELSVRGPDYQVLKTKVDEMIERFKKSGLMTDIDTDFRDGVTEIHVTPDREKAAASGVSVADISSTINAAMGGVRIGKFTSDNRRYDVRVRLIPEQWQSAQDINQLLIRTSSGELVPLASVVTLTEEKKLLTITREMRERAINIYANTAKNKSLTDVTAFATQTAQEILPDNYHMTAVGASKDFANTQIQLALLFVFSIVTLYMVLAVQFNSFTHPFSIMSVLIFTLTGALLALLITNRSINIYSIIGIIVLMGIATKNSILLVEFFNQKRFAEGFPLRQAILLGAPIRLRPILMTSTATIAAMIPLAVGLGPGAEARAPLGVVVIGGIIVSTAFSLLVVPCLYSLLAPLELDQYKGARELDKLGEKEEAKIPAPTDALN